MAKKGNSGNRASAPARSNPAPAPSRGASQAAVQAFVASNPNSRTAQAAASPAQPKPTTVNQGLKIAGAGGITKQELQNISDTTGRSGAQVVQRLDALNQKLKSQDQVGISLNSGAANMLIRQAQNAPITMKSLYGGNQQFGTGQIGKQLQGMVGTRSAFGIQGTPGTGRMMGGTAIRPGGRTTVQGFGKQFAGMPTSGIGNAMPVTETPAVATEAAPIAAPEMLPEPLPEEEKVDQMMPGSSADLANWATGFKTKRSSRRGAGPRAQGLGSQRVNPSGTFRGGM